jgi:hypothetical protein
MFTRFITASALSVTLAFSSAAFAASTNFIDNGSYTTDTISGLDWRDVTATQGQSYNSVSGQFGVGGNFEGYRYATGAEFNKLITNYTGSTIAPGYTGRTSIPIESDLGALITMLGATSQWTFATYIGVDPTGPTIRQITLITWGMLADVAHRGAHYSGRYGTTYFDNHYLARVFEKSHDTIPVLAFAETRDGAQPDYRTSSITGSYLVRTSLNPVPIPAAAFMFAPALLGFLGLRRRSKRA